MKGPRFYLVSAAALRTLSEQKGTMGEDSTASGRGSVSKWLDRWRHGWYVVRGGARRTDELAPREGYRRWAASYGHEPNALQVIEARAIRKLLPDLSGKTVLDMGCGKARLAQMALAAGAARAVAADFALDMLTEPDTPRGDAMHRLAANIVSLPFPAASFDTVACCLVLGHVRNLERALAAMAAVLRPGGHLLISDFHPFATLRGWQRTFIDQESGLTYAVEQHLHLFSKYLTAFRRLGLELQTLDERCWEGYPVIFALRARKLEEDA